MYANTSLAQNAYAPASAATHTERDVEYHAFAYVTGLLAGAKDMAQEIGGKPKLAEAMFENVRLWIALAADAASDANQLPRETRAQIIGLANFARTHMDKVLAGAAEVDALIDVNLAIMKGLRGETGEESGVA
jgi:Flagellar biosynthesis regulator FlaF